MKELLEQYKALEKLHTLIAKNVQFPLDNKHKSAILTTVASRIFNVLDEIDAIKRKEKENQLV